MENREEQIVFRSSLILLISSPPSSSMDRTHPLQLIRELITNAYEGGKYRFDSCLGGPSTLRRREPCTDSVSYKSCRTKRPTSTDSTGCYLGQPRYPTQQKMKKMCRRILCVIPPLEFRNVEVEEARGNDVVCPVQRPLKLRPKSFNGIRMHVTFDVLLRTVLHRTVVYL